MFLRECVTQENKTLQMSLRHSIQQQFSYGVEHNKGFHS